MHIAEVVQGQNVGHDLVYPWDNEALFLQLEDDQVLGNGEIDKAC